MQYFPQPTMMMGGGPMGPSPTPLGYGGYNGGYFANSYATFNPYEIQRRNQEYQKQMQENIKMQQNVMYNMYLASCNGKDPNPTIVNQIFGTNQNPDIAGFTQEQNMEYNSILQKEKKLIDNNAYIDQMTMNMVPVEVNQQQYFANLQRMQNDRQNMQDMDMYTYFATVAVDDLREAKMRELKQQQSNLTSLYNQNSYNQFLNKFRLGMPVDPTATTDDMTITLPSIVSEQERMERRRQFMAQIGIQI